jgi:hypothetical protein
MSNETQGYPDLELCEVMVGQVFLGWVECRNEDTGKTVHQWVLLKANRQLWPLAFEAAESDRLTQVGVGRVKAWQHFNMPVVAPTIIAAVHQPCGYRTLRNNPQA